MNPCILQDMNYYHNKINNIDLHTIGCELSEWDGERIVELIASENKDDIIIVNTCAVTESSQKASEGVVQMLHYIYPDKKMYITGCGVNYNPNYYKNYGICLPNESKFDCNEYNVYNPTKTKTFIHNRDKDVGYVKVQDGCSNHCTYCVVNKLRNVNISLPIEDIMEQIDTLISQGKSNIDIIGTEICTYNYKGLTIDTLCEKILQTYPLIKKLSLNALNPNSDRVEKIIDLMMKYPNMDKTLYLSVQSGSDNILKLMGRKYTHQRLIDIYEYNPHIKQMWDLIIGFPGETEEHFNQTLELIKYIKPIELMICPYSNRDNAPAKKLPNHVDENIIKDRIILCRTLIKNIDNQDSVQLPNIRTFKINLYNDKEVARLYRYLDETNDSMILEVDYDYYGDNEKFEINNKMLAIRFGVIYKINFINKEPKYINDFCEYMNGVKNNA